MRTFATEFDLEIIYVYVLYKSTQTIHSFHQNCKNHTCFHIGGTLEGYGRMLGTSSLYLLLLLGAGGLFPTPPPPSIECHTLQ